jgi:hypothetical protein
MVTSWCVYRPGNHPDKLGRLIAVCVKHLYFLLPLYVFSSKYNKHNRINCQMPFNILHRNERSAHWGIKRKSPIQCPNKILSCSSWLDQV